MNYEPRHSQQRLPLDKLAAELLSSHQQKLYNRGIYAQMTTAGFLEADQRLGTILPAAYGLFAPLTSFSLEAMEEYFLYIKSLEDNKGPMATMMRRIARVHDLSDSIDNGYSVSGHTQRAEKSIENLSPKSFHGGMELRRAFEPYVSYTAGGEINIHAFIPTSQSGASGGTIFTRPTLESVEIMKHGRDQFISSPQGHWNVVLVSQERGGSVVKMYFEGGHMSDIRYNGASVYNNLEEDYYSSERYFLTLDELKSRLLHLFSRCDWTLEKYQATSLSPEQFVGELQAVGEVWKPVDFSQVDVSGINLDDDYGYRDRIHKGQGMETVPNSLAAFEYSHPQSYAEWVINPSKSVDPELISADAPPSFFEDRHWFYCHWKVTGNTTYYVRGCYNTGEIEISRNRKFEEESRTNYQPVTLTDPSRYVLAQYLRQCRKNYLDELGYWYRRIKLDPPQHLLDAKAAYNPEPAHD